MPMKPTTKATLVVLGLSVALGLLVKIPEQWFYTDFQSTPRPQGLATAITEPDPDKDGIKKEDVRFLCRTNSSVSIQEMWNCHGWIYTPIKEVSLQTPNNKFPIIIMAHGIGSTKDMGLDKFAQRFATAGFMVLLFDYLHFGLSDGKPRHVINPLQHVMDYRSAIKYAQSIDNVDRRRVALWGTSYAGGHVLVTASKEKSNIKAVISQMPFLGALPTENPLDEMQKRGITNVVKGLIGAASSKLRIQLGMTGLYSRLYGHVGDNEKMAVNWWETFQGSEKKWLEKHPKDRKDCDWRNAVATDSLFDMIKYKPVNHINNIDTKNTKVMIIKAKNDKLTPTNRMDYVIDILKCESHEEDTTHFGMYTGSIFDSNIKVQIDFFKRQLTPSK
eukprot:CAMPEP_0201572090 /NCGR_PEP_ID=MMETSP0190_2-20130828/15149_1 /ASSEMBLY_ACC=CAM_ASM_000263 /TAXON_ID=37353 /ORGANISM="Rosalina sp." /LENGTH=387 /DNA_ID=CAMNT_0047997407 /DNA_START=16 /DNA_END=1176 /DNA_ORIENTATION=+